MKIFVVIALCVFIAICGYVYGLASILDEKEARIIGKVISAICFAMLTGIILTLL